MLASLANPCRPSPVVPLILLHGEKEEAPQQKTPQLQAAQGLKRQSRSSFRNMKRVILIVVNICVSLFLFYELDGFCKQLQSVFDGCF